MDQKEINNILKRYYEGITTGNEEELLEEYFSGSDIPSELEAEKEWFRYRRANVPGPGEDFFVKLSSIPLNENKKGYSVSHKFIAPLRIAAMISLLITGYLFVRNIQSAPAYMKDTYNDPVVAMAEVQKILSQVSSNMNKGTGELSEINRLSVVPEALAPFARASATAKKSMESLGKSNNNPENKK